jgi:hypothetical protein
MYQMAVQVLRSVQFSREVPYVAFASTTSKYLDKPTHSA